jgi:hypothetical protein
VLRTRCYETEGSLFLQPIVEAITPVVARTPAGVLRDMLGEHATASASLLPEVAALLGPRRRRGRHRLRAGRIHHLARAGIPELPVHRV